jgi:hypothetical protein
MGFVRYIKEAFVARPWGMWVAPNLVGLAAFALLGLVTWGLWIVGAGLELGYLLMLATNPRFQRWVDSKDTQAAKKSVQQQIALMLVRLGPADQTRYRQFEARCQRILGEQHDVPTAEMQTQAEGFGKLLYVYLKLLLTRAAILRVLEGASGKSIDVRISEVQDQLKGAGTPELQKSLGDQLEILTERKKRHGEAWDKLQFIESELSRIQEQVELIREGMVVAADAGGLSRKIDTVGDTLGATTQWIRQQQELLGQTEDLLGDTPPVALEVPAAPPPPQAPPRQAQRA